MSRSSVARSAGNVRPRRQTSPRLPSRRAPPPLAARAAAIIVLLASLTGCQVVPSAGKDMAGVGPRCPAGEAWTDAVVAESLGVDHDRLQRLKAARALSNEDLCTMPAKRLARAQFRVDNPKPDHPGEWASFRALQQADESGTVKPDGLIAASAARQRILDRLREGSVSAQDAGISRTDWTWLGPGNIGGRVRAILVDRTNGNRVWAGSVAGGIWESGNGGSSWAPVDDFMGNLSISSLAQDPTDASLLYAGTGEGFYNVDAVRGAGVFRSTDRGVSWEALASTSPASNPDWYYVNRLVIHPSNGNILMAATNGGLYRSADAGANWTEVRTGRHLDVRFHPADGNRVLASSYSGNTATIAYSTNAGASWNTTTLTGYRAELAWAASTTSTAYLSLDHQSASSGRVYRSTDGGANWTLMSTPAHLSGQGWYNNAIWVDPTNANHLIVGGIDLYRSTDGGSVFTKISQWWSVPTSPHADHHAIVAHPGYNGSTNRTLFFGNDGGVYRAADIAAVGLTTGWTNLNNGLGITQFYGGAGHNGVNGRIQGGTQDNGALLYSGSGTNWSEWYGGDGGAAAIDPADGNTMYNEYVYLSIYRSTNGGGSSAYICNGITEGHGHATFGCGATATTEANFIAPFVLDPNDSNRMLAGAKSLWRSNNVKSSPPTWAAIKSPVGTGTSYYISRVAVAQGNSDVIWVGHNNGAVYKTTNGTATTPTWSTLSGLPSGRMVLSLLIDRDDPNRVYVGFGGYSSGNVYRTTNGGNSWTNIHGNLPNAPVRALERHPANPNWLYAGTEVGVFTSEDGGATWSTNNDGPANVSVEQLFWLDNTTLVAVTHGRGMFRATVNGPGTLQFTAASADISEGAGTLNLQVSRINGSSGAASVLYSTANGTATAGSDYVQTTGNLNWDDGDSANKPLPITISQDGLVEGNQTFTVTLSGATGATLGSPASTTVTIIDDDGGAIAGACGSANGVLTASAPATNLCSAGSPSAVTTAASSYTWICYGVNGGASANCSAPRAYTVSASVSGSNGTISPSSRTVAYGQTTTFMVTPSTGYTATVSGCNGSLAGGTYTTSPVTADCAVTASFSPQPVVTSLQNGVPVTSLSGTLGIPVYNYYSFQVPQNVTNVSISISGGTGDADLYVLYGALPALDAWDCRPYYYGNIESCSFTPGTPGTYYIMLNPYESFSGVTLTANYTWVCLTDEYVTLDNMNIAGAMSASACRTTTVGPNSAVGSAANLSLEAGEKIIFRPTFRVNKGGGFRAIINPALRP